MLEFINQNLLFVAIPTVIIVALLWLWSEKRRTRTLKSIISDKMAPALLSSACGLRRSWRNILFTAAWIILAFCLLRPFSGVDIEERKQQVRDILVIFDVSNSMNVVDCYGESRLDYGRNLIRKLAADSSSDRFGLMSFSGLAFIEIPLTTDTVSFDIALEGISKHKIPLGGTNIQIALNQALKEFKEGAEHKAMILISDGEEIGGDYRDAAKLLKEKNVKLINVLTGDERKAGAVKDQKGFPLRDRSGQIITSKADSKLLKELASETDGVFINFDPNGNTYQQLAKLKNEISSINSLEGENEVIKKPREIYQPFLLVAIVLLLIRMFFGERKKNFKSLALILAFMFSVPQIRAQQTVPTAPAQQLSEEQKAALMNLQHDANKLKQQAVNDTLEEKFRSLAWYNLATNLTKQHEINPVEPVKPPKPDDKNKMAAPVQEPEPGSLSKAEEAFDQAIEFAGEQRDIKAAALHNKGTLYQKEAQKIFLQDPDQATSYLNSAVDLFKKALVLNSGDIQTRKNLERAFIDIQYAKTAKEIHKLHQEAKSKAGNSLFSFRKLKDVPARSPESLKEIRNNNAIVIKNSETIKLKLKDIERTDGQPLYDKVIDHENKARLTLGQIDKAAAESTEKDLAEAYKLLGGNPDEEPNQDQNSDSDNKQQEENKDQEENKQDGEKNKDKDKDQQDQKENKDQDQKDKSDKSESSNDKKEEEKNKDQELDPNQDGQFNKNDEKQPEMSKEEKERRSKIQEAEALLRKMSDTEKEVREHIRERQAEMLRQEMRRQGIKIPPEANK